MQAANLHKQASYDTNNKHKARSQPIKINNINKQAARLFKEGNPAIIYLLLNNGEPIPNKNGEDVCNFQGVTICPNNSKKDEV